MSQSENAENADPEGLAIEQKIQSRSKFQSRLEIFNPDRNFQLGKEIEGAQTVKCKPWTERVAEKGLSRGVSRAAWKRRTNPELEAKKAHKPWIREGLNREVQTVN